MPDSQNNVPVNKIVVSERMRKMRVDVDYSSTVEKITHEFYSQEKAKAILINLTIRFLSMYKDRYIVLAMWRLLPQYRDISNVIERRETLKQDIHYARSLKTLSDKEDSLFDRIAAACAAHKPEMMAAIISEGLEKYYDAKIDCAILPRLSPSGPTPASDRESQHEEASSPKEEQPFLREMHTHTQETHTTIQKQHTTNQQIQFNIFNYFAGSGESETTPDLDKSNLLYPAEYTASDDDLINEEEDDFSSGDCTDDAGASVPADADDYPPDPQASSEWHDTADEYISDNDYEDIEFNTEETAPENDDVYYISGTSSSTSPPVKLWDNPRKLKKLCVAVLIIVIMVSGAVLICDYIYGYKFDFTVDLTARFDGDKTWSDELYHARVGDMVQLQLKFVNDRGILSPFLKYLGDKLGLSIGAHDVMVRFFLPDNLEYIENSTIVYNSGHPDGIYATPDTAITTGINVGNYLIGGDAYVRLYCRVVDNGLKAGENLLVAHANATVADQVKHDEGVSIHLVY